MDYSEWCWYIHHECFWEGSTAGVLAPTELQFLGATTQASSLRIVAVSSFFTLWMWDRQCEMSVWDDRWREPDLAASDHDAETQSTSLKSHWTPTPNGVFSIGGWTNLWWEVEFASTYLQLLCCGQSLGSRSQLSMMILLCHHCWRYVSHKWGFELQSWLFSLSCLSGTEMELST